MTRGGRAETGRRRSLDVFVDPGRNAPTRAGKATFGMRGAATIVEFEYAESYLADPGAYDLAPGLPLQRAPHVSDGLPGPLADTSPDWWGRTLISRKLYLEATAAGQDPPLVTDYDFLVGVSDRTRQGALRVAEQSSPTSFLATTDDVPRLVDLARLLAASDRVVTGEPDSESDDEPDSDLRLLLQAGSATLGGARPKASVTDGQSLAVAKFPHPHDSWDVMAWEMTALDLAEAAGIVVPRRRLESIDGRAVLVVDRFDRRGDERVGYISALTLMNTTGTAGHDYVDLAAAIGDHGADPDSDIFQLWRRIAFSVAVHNTDDHMRNHGFVRTGAGWRLSPVFDVNPNPHVAEPRSSSILGASDRRAEAGALVAAAEMFGVSRRGVDVIIGEVVDAVQGWAEVARRNGIRSAELDTFAPMFARTLDDLRSVQR